MRILFLTGRETTYARNDVLLRAFRRFATVEVVRPTQQKQTLLRSLLLPLQALTKLRDKSYDLIFVGFYGQALMLTVPFLAGSNILFDAFISTFDTLTGDRQRFSPHSIPGRLARWLDRTTANRADHILLDTRQHVDYFHDTFSTPMDKMSAVPVGCSEALFHPMRVPQQPVVLFYGSYQPLHGVETVVQAAGLLRAAPYRFRLIGAGQTLPAAQNIAERLGLDNVSFEPPVPLQDLPAAIASASLCLGGHFGVSEKAGRVIPGKIYQMLAMQRPVVAANTPANKDLLADGESAYLVPPGDPQALAEAIRKAMEDPTGREQVAAAGREAFLSFAGEARIASQLEAIARKVAG